MTIAEARTSCKAALLGLLARLRARIQGLPKDVLVVLVLILASGASFGLGLLTGQQMGQGGPFELSQVPQEEADLEAAVPAAIPTGGQIVASKNGTKYYAPNCSGAARIAAANRVYFASTAAAEAAGYSPAASCK